MYELFSSFSLVMAKELNNVLSIRSSSGQINHHLSLYWACAPCWLQLSNAQSFISRLLPARGCSIHSPDSLLSCEPYNHNRPHCWILFLFTPPFPPPPNEVVKRDNEGWKVMDCEHTRPEVIRCWLFEVTQRMTTHRKRWNIIWWSSTSSLGVHRSLPPPPNLY